MLSNIRLLCLSGLTRPTASTCQHEGVSILPVRRVKARKAFDQEKVSGGRMRRSPLNFLLHGSLKSVSAFRLGSLFV